MRLCYFVVNIVSNLTSTLFHAIFNRTGYVIIIYYLTWRTPIYFDHQPPLVTIIRNEETNKEELIITDEGGYSYKLFGSGLLRCGPLCPCRSLRPLHPPLHLSGQLAAQVGGVAGAPHGRVSGRLSGRQLVPESRHFFATFSVKYGST